MGHLFHSMVARHTRVEVSSQVHLKKQCRRSNCVAEKKELPVIEGFTKGKHFDVNCIRAGSGGVWTDVHVACRLNVRAFFLMM